MRSLVLAFALSDAPRRVLAATAVATVLALATMPAAGKEGEWTATTLAEDLDIPVELVFGPDGSLYYAELDTGNIRVIPPGANAPSDIVVAHVDSTRSENGGFLGLALDPDFDETGAFFVYYSMTKAGASGGQVNRVSRIDASGETVLLDDIPWFERHDGGRIVFTGPDTLVVATGDNERRDPAQADASVLGKMLRMTREGKPAPDNPDPTSLVWSKGHRNPFGLAWDKDNGVLYETENGPQRGDEINVIVGGKNYGWPAVVGVARHPSYVDPIFAYEKTIGPTGATVMDGVLYYGAVNDGTVRQLSRHENGSYIESTIYDGGPPSLDVEAGPDGRLYVGTWNSIVVLSPPGTEPPGDAPPEPTPTPIVVTDPTPTGPPTATVTSSPVESADPAPAAGASIPSSGALLGIAALAAVAVIRRLRA